MSTIEGWHTCDDGEKLYTKTWKTASAPKARAVFLHGFSDHCNAYRDFFPVLAESGIEVYAFDQRGWGRSVTTKASRGRTGPTSRVLADITSIIEALPPSTLPFFLMGHSMGGAETLVYAAEGPASVRARIRGYVVESPWVGLNPKAQPWGITIAAGRLASKVIPHVQMVQKLDVTTISRDPEVQRSFEEDDLCHDTGTLEGFAGMLDRAAGLLSGKTRVTEGSFWVGHGTGDLVCAYDATRTWFEGLEVKDKTMVSYDGYYHRLHAEPGDDKIRYGKDVVAWIMARLD